VACAELDKIQSEYVLGLVKKREAEVQNQGIAAGGLWTDTIKSALRTGNVNTRNIFTVNDSLDRFVTTFVDGLYMLAFLQFLWLGNPHAAVGNRGLRPLLCPVDWKEELVKLANLIGERQAHSLKTVVQTHGNNFKNACGTIGCNIALGSAQRRLSFTRSLDVPSGALLVILRVPQSAAILTDPKLQVGMLGEASAV
jgi:hypothetical protein